MTTTMMPAIGSGTSAVPTDSPTSTPPAPRDIWFKLRVTETERRKIEDDARAAGMRPADYVRRQLGLPASDYGHRARKPANPTRTPVRAKKVADTTSGAANPATPAPDATPPTPTPSFRSLIPRLR